MATLAANELEKRVKLLEAVDSVILSVSEKIINDTTFPDSYSENVVALANLVEARATLVKLP